MIQPVGDDGVVIRAATSETLNIRADLNGLATVCVYDTGSSFSLLLSQSDADNLKLPHGDAVYLGTASGTTAGYRTSVTVTIGGKSYVVDDAVVAPTHKWFPLIGVPLAKRLGRITTIDWVANEVELDPTPDITPIVSFDVFDRGTKDDYEIFAVGSDVMTVSDGRTVKLEVPAMMIKRKGDNHASTVVPARPPFEAKGIPVNWDKDKGIASM